MNWQDEQKKVATGVTSGQEIETLKRCLFQMQEAAQDLVQKSKREWVGLTDQEIWTVLQFRGYSKDNIEIAKAIEAKLKEKNSCNS